MYVWNVFMALSSLPRRRASASSRAFLTAERSVTTVTIRPPDSSKLSANDMISNVMCIFLSYVEARTCLARVKVVMTDNISLWEAEAEIRHVLSEGFSLLRCTRVGGSPVKHSAYIHNVPARIVESFCPIGDFPAVDTRILVVIDKTLDTSVKVYHVSISDLLPSAPTLAYRRSVPATYFRRCYLAPRFGSSAMNHKSFQI